MPFPEGWAREFEFQQRPQITLMKGAGGDTGQGRPDQDGVGFLSQHLGVSPGDVQKLWHDDFTGLCDGYCIVWMGVKIRHSLGKRAMSPGEREQALSHKSGMAKALEAHTDWAGGRWNANKTKEDMASWTHFGDTFFQHEPVSLKTFESGDPARNIANEVKRVSGGCTQLDFPCYTTEAAQADQPSKGNHAIAFYASHGGNIYCFDPNFGEFKFGSSRLEAFLNALVAHPTYNGLLSVRSNGLPTFTLRRWELHDKQSRNPLRVYGR